jgi:membrane protease YdiL (CAAX protease family)
MLTAGTGLQSFAKWAKDKVLPLLVLIISLGIAATAAHFARGTANPTLIGNLTLGLCVVVGGLVCFNARDMGLLLTGHLSRHVGFGLLPLTGILLLNAVGTPLSALDLTQLNLPKNLVTGFWEETVFRGFLLAWWISLFGLKSDFSKVGYLMVSSLLFAVVHANEGLLFAYRFGLGFLLAVLVVNTRTIYLAILLHALNNALVDVLGGNVDENIRLIGIGLLCCAGIIAVVRTQSKYSLKWP